MKSLCCLTFVGFLLTFTLCGLQVCLWLARWKMVCKQEVQEGTDEIVGADEAEEVAIAWSDEA